MPAIMAKVQMPVLNFGSVCQVMLRFGLLPVGRNGLEDVLTPLLQYVQKVTLFEIDQPRACTHQVLQKKIKNFPGMVKLAQEKDIPQLRQQLSPNSFVLITGSIYLIASILSFHQHAQKSKSSQSWQDLW